MLLISKKSSWNSLDTTLRKLETETYNEAIQNFNQKFFESMYNSEEGDNYDLIVNSLDPDWKIYRMNGKRIVVKNGTYNSLSYSPFSIIGSEDFPIREVLQGEDFISNMNILLGGFNQISEIYFSPAGVTLWENSLIGLDFPNQIVSIRTNSIPERCFLECTGKLQFEEGLVSIGLFALRLSTYSNNILIFKNDIPPNLYAQAITSGTKIYVPYGKGDIYKGATNWSFYSDSIFELNSDGSVPGGV